MPIDDKNLSIKEAQQIVDEWIKTVGVRYYNELTKKILTKKQNGTHCATPKTKN